MDNQNLTEMTLSDPMDSELVLEDPLNEGENMDLEEVLDQNADENTDDVEALNMEDLSDMVDNVIEKEEKKKKHKEMGILEQVMKFSKKNLNLILGVVFVIVLICVINRKNNLGVKAVDDVCNYLSETSNSILGTETSVEEVPLEQQMPAMQSGGSVDNITSSLETMSSTSGSGF